MPSATVLRCNFSVFHDRGDRVSSFALELRQSAEGGLSVTEYSTEGEFVAECPLDGDDEADWDAAQIHRAMRALWAGREDVPCQHVVSVRASCLLTHPAGEIPASVMLGWHYRQLAGEGVLEVWSEQQVPALRHMATPQAKGLRGWLLDLQQAASLGGYSHQ